MRNLFSDWNFSQEVLAKFGNIVVQIQKGTNDKTIVFWTFLKFISKLLTFISISI